MPVGLKQQRFSDLSDACLKKNKRSPLPKNHPVPVGNFPNPWMAEWRSNIVKTLEEGGNGGGNGCSDQVEELKDQIKALESRLQRVKDKQPANRSTTPDSSTTSNPSSSSNSSSSSGSSNASEELEAEQADAATAQAIKEIESKEEFDAKSKEELVNMLMDVRQYIPKKVDVTKNRKLFQEALLAFAKEEGKVTTNLTNEEKDARKKLLVRLMMDALLKMVAMSDADYQDAYTLLQNLVQIDDTSTSQMLDSLSSNDNDDLQKLVRIFEGIIKEDLKAFDSPEVRKQIAEKIMLKLDGLQTKPLEQRTKALRISLNLEKDQAMADKVKKDNAENAATSNAAAAERKKSEVVYKQWIETWKKLYKLSTIPQSPAGRKALINDAKGLNADLGSVMKRWVNTANNAKATNGVNYYALFAKSNDEIKELSGIWFGNVNVSPSPNGWERDELNGLVYRLENFDGDRSKFRQRIQNQLKEKSTDAYKLNGIDGLDGLLDELLKRHEGGTPAPNPPTTTHPRITPILLAAVATAQMRKPPQPPAGFLAGLQAGKDNLKKTKSKQGPVLDSSQSDNKSPPPAPRPGPAPAAFLADLQAGKDNLKKTKSEQQSSYYRIKLGTTADSTWVAGIKKGLGVR